MFDCGDDGVVVIDGRADPHTVANERIEADCTVTISRQNLVALMSGELDPMMGFMTGQFRVAGDMGVALKLQRLA
jgi:putative sterol carrier protein